MYRDPNGFSISEYFSIYQTHHKTLLFQNSVLKSKLRSKVDALFIMSKELDKCSMERDRYKVLVEQLKCKNFVPIKSQDNDSSIYQFTPTNTISCSDILAKTREHNDMLKLEVCYLCDVKSVNISTKIKIIFHSH